MYPVCLQTIVPCMSPDSTVPCVSTDSTVPCVSTPRVVAVLTSVCRTFPESVELLEKVLVAFGQVANTEGE